MMKRFLLSVAITAALALTIALTACSSSSGKEIALQAQKADPLLTGFATLANSGNPAEMAAAPVYSRLALYRHRAGASLNTGLISIDQAKQAQATADSIRRQLDSARADGRVLTIQGLSRLLDLAINSLNNKP